MVYVRGGKDGFDKWKTQYGCIGWDYTSILPYFNKVEKTVPILRASEDNSFFKAMVRACKENNIPYNPNYNDPKNGEFGISPFQFLIDSSEPSSLKRETAYSSYVHLVGIRGNLTIRTDVLVSHLVFNESKKCTGVQFYDMSLGDCNDDVIYEVSIKNDVIISAGSIGTPQILMLSGIGCCDHLSKFGIGVISHLPGVGQNLQDDLFVTAGFLSKQPVNPDPYGLLGMVIFWPSKLSSDTKCHQPPATDIEASLGSGAMVGMGLPQNIQQSYWIWPNIQKLKSRGTVKLQSNSIFDHPLVDPNYLAEPSDLRRCVDALKLAIKIGSSGGMKDWYKSQISPPSTSTSNEDLVKYIRENAGTCHHFAGTARMGRKTDPMAVVSPETLMVHGVTGLRVIDASIIPETVSGNTQGATMMIGEKGSDIILRSAARKLPSSL